MHKKRTPTQNNSLHLWFDQLADALNSAGWNVQKTLRHDVEVPWSGVLIKEMIYRPVMEAMTGKHSTTELDTVEISEVFEVLNLHLGEKLGIFVPWPSESSQYGEKNENTNT